MYHFGHVLRYLGRPLHVIEPCVGLGGFREFCRLSEVSYHSSGAFDFHPSFQGFYDNVNQGTSTPEAKGLRLGPVDGDVMGLPIEELQDAELLLSGPPCQPFAEGGRHGGADDPRSEVYETVVGWVIELAWRGVLVMFLIENSCNMKSYAFFWEMFRRLASCIPFFAIDVVELDLADIYPHRRRRMWLRGMRRDACGHSSLPQPLGRADMQAPFGGVSDSPRRLVARLPERRPRRLVHRSLAGQHERLHGHDHRGPREGDHRHHRGRGARPFAQKGLWHKGHVRCHASPEVHGPVYLPLQRGRHRSGADEEEGAPLPAR
ncbi:unnamed protein product [Prorocentrum cordatum]|uniref:DNA (cytosine-5-)-methyltransferase n=1 Tax=Prorocentrum cordatum TaxID=2364126 RepID=A0ABN9VV96_9DINO|nr:unnamed protein product [Polarella glacialis]